MTEPNPAGVLANKLRSFGIALDVGCSDKQIMVHGSWITAQELFEAEKALKQQADEIERLRALLARARDRIDEMERNSGHDYELDWTPEEETLLGLIDAALSQESADA